MHRLRRAGSRGIIVDLPDSVDIDRVLALTSGPLAGLIDHTIPASRSVLVVAAADEHVTGVRAAIDDSLRNGERAVTASATEPRTHIVRTRYEGEDLAEVSALCGMSEREFVRAHVESEHRVAFFGFAPGFAYIDGSDPRLEPPRRSSPRTSIPAGIVAVAAGQSVIYPGGTPGGWHLIGSTDFVSWNIDSEHPTPFSVGDRIVFEPIGGLP